MWKPVTVILNTALVVAAVWFVMTDGDRDPFGLGLLLTLVAIPMLNTAMIVLRAAGRAR